MKEELNLILCAFEKIKKEKFDRSLYQNRLIVQKLAYTMKFMNYSIPYKFSWHLMGPYSKELTADIFGSNISEPVSGADITKIQGFIQGEIGNPDKMELIASILYLIKERGKSLEKEDDLLFTLQTLKPKFTSAEIKDAIQKIKPIVN